MWWLVPGVLHRARLNPGPVAIGGVGGSGTRLVAKLLHEMGVFNAGPVRPNHDNMAFPRFRKRFELWPGRYRLRTRMKMHATLVHFESRLHDDYLQRRSFHHNWCWKTPTTFFWLDPVARYFPRLKYIHVMRNGLDIAYARNQRQFHEWAPFFGIATDPFERTRVLEYWCRANHYAMHHGRRLLGRRMLVVNFDRLCQEPEPVLHEIAEFVQADESSLDMQALVATISPPVTLGRYRRTGYQKIFSPAMLEEVAAFGFSVDS